ncbi:MAG: hypothetical protein HRT73_01485 [Flavobacteriales bacterium]|nr:hypothetical protein [Flavobacteriales bacterium]
MVVLLFKKEGDTVTVEGSHVKYENWRTDHVLTSKYFGLKSSRPYNKKLEDFMIKRSEILKKTELSDGDKIFLSEFTDKIGLLPTGETYQDMEMLQFVREVSKAKGYEKDN